MKIDINEHFVCHNELFKTLNHFMFQKQIEKSTFCHYFRNILNKLAQHFFFFFSTIYMIMTVLNYSVQQTQFIV